MTASRNLETFLNITFACVCVLAGGMHVMGYVSGGLRTTCSSPSTLWVLGTGFLYEPFHQPGKDILKPGQPGGEKFG